jgi:hypothetical protein
MVSMTTLRALRDTARLRGDHLASRAINLDLLALGAQAECGGRETLDVLRLRLDAEICRLAAAVLGHRPD